MAPHVYRPRCKPEWIDKLEQRLAVAASISGGSHVLREHDDVDTTQTDAHGKQQPENLVGADFDAEQMIDTEGCVAALSNPLRVSRPYWAASPYILPGLAWFTWFSRQQLPQGLRENGEYPIRFCSTSCTP